jgi:hypothetical protein
VVGRRHEESTKVHGARRSGGATNQCSESGTRVVTALLFRDLGFRESLTPCWASLLGWAPGPFCQRLVGRLGSGSRAGPSRAEPGRARASSSSPSFFSRPTHDYTSVLQRRGGDGARADKMKRAQSPESATARACYFCTQSPPRRIRA